MGRKRKNGEANETMVLDETEGVSSEELVQRIIQAAGHTSQSLGIGRVTGQIYAHVYFSIEPQSLDDLTKGLGISKGSASMGVRQLEQWGGLEKIWVKGDRKDYYRSRDTFGKIIKNAIVDLIGKRMEISSALLGDVEKELSASGKKNADLTEEQEFVRQKLRGILDFQKKSETIWDGFIVKMLK